MGQDHSRAPAVPGDLAEEGITSLASGGFDRKLSLLRPSRDVFVFALVFQPVTVGLFNDELRIVATLGAQRVIKVTDGQLPESCVYQRMQKHRGIASSGNADQCRLIRTQPRMFRNGAFDRAG